MKKFILVCLFSSFLYSFNGLLGVSAYSLFKVPKWEVVYMKVGSYDIVIPNEVENAFIIFDKNYGRAGGIVGCNHFTNFYKVTSGGKIIEISPGGLTQMACGSSFETQIETIFNSHFNGKFVVRSSNDIIELVKDNFIVGLTPSISLDPDYGF